MNILGKFTALAALALATTALGSCDSMFHDDLADCPQGVFVGRSAHTHPATRSIASWVR